MAEPIKPHKHGDLIYSHRSDKLPQLVGTTIVTTAGDNPCPIGKVELPSPTVLGEDGKKSAERRRKISMIPKVSKTEWGTQQIEMVKRPRLFKPSPSPPSLFFGNGPLTAYSHSIIGETDDHSILEPKIAPNQTLANFEKILKALNSKDEESDDDWQFAESGTMQEIITTSRSDLKGISVKQHIILKTTAMAARPIKDSLDKIDQKIVDMKRAGYTDARIASTLFEKFRVEYNPKSIATRWRRMRLKLAKRKEADLDEGSCEWTSELDLALLRTVYDVDEFIRAEKQKIEAKRWELHYQYLKYSNQNVLCTPKMCRERLLTLQPTYPDHLHNSDVVLAPAERFGVGKNANTSITVPDNMTQQATPCAMHLPTRAKDPRQTQKPKDISTLPCKMQLALQEQALRQASGEFLDGVALLPVESMSRDSLRKEIKVRNGKIFEAKSDLVEELKRLRAGLPRPSKRVKRR